MPIEQYTVRLTKVLWGYKLSICENCGKEIGFFEKLNSTSTEAESNLCRKCYKASIEELENLRIEEAREKRCKELNMNEREKNWLSVGKCIYTRRYIYPLIRLLIEKK